MNNCPKCGQIANQGEKFCGKCGSALPTIQNYVNMNNQTNQYPQYTSNRITNPADDELIDAYIGDKAKKIRNTKFSFCTLFFGVIYLFYRKMWLIGSAWIVVSILLNTFLPSLSSPIGNIIRVILAIQFSKLYLKQAADEVNKIKQDSPGLSKEQLKEKCRRKGGTTVVPVIIILVLYLFLFIYFFNRFMRNLDESDVNDEIIANKSEVVDDGKFGSLNIDIPNDFIKSEYSTTTYESYTLKDDNDYCNLRLNKISGPSGYKDAKTYLEKNLYYSENDTYSGISTVKLNNNDWYYANIITSYSNRHYYSINRNSDIYNVEFIIISDQTEKCYDAYSKIIKSMEFD